MKLFDPPYDIYNKLISHITHTTTTKQNFDNHHIQSRAIEPMTWGPILYALAYDMLFEGVGGRLLLLVGSCRSFLRKSFLGRQMEILSIHRTFLRKHFLDWNQGLLSSCCLVR